MGHVDQFEVVLDNKLAVYSEGDRISGHVNIVNSEDIKYKVIRLELSGVAIVFWTRLNVETKEPIVGHDPSNSTESGVKGDVVREQYMEKIVFLEKDGTFLDKDPVLSPGEHSFPFDCKLPPELPSSFEGQYGQIRYTAQAVIERSGFKSNVTCRRVFTVLSGLDLTFLPEAAAKIEICKYKELGICCTDGSVTIDWAVDRSGFVPGEDIMICGSIQNDSKQTVSYSTVALFMVVEYKSKKRWRRERRRIGGVEKGATTKDEVTVWNDPLHIPPLPPTGLGRCKLIDITYELEVRIEGGYTPVVCTKELYIGTVPASGHEVMTYAAMTPTVGQPSYLLSPVSRLDDDDTDSLTEMIAAVAGGTDTVADPSAPALCIIERIVPAGSGGCCDHEGIYPHIVASEERPPPFAPGHSEELLVGGAEEWFIDEAPSAPSATTLMRVWPTEEISAFNPSFHSSCPLDGSNGPQQLNQPTSDHVPSELVTYHPVYVYYPTLGAGGESG